MNVTSSATAQLDAGHSIPDLPRCVRPGHGHSWTITVTVEDDLDPRTGWVRGSADLPLRLQTFVDQMQSEDLDEMLPGVITSPLGLASATMERLLLRFPKIVSVRVDCSDHTSGEIRRTPPQR